MVVEPYDPDCSLTVDEKGTSSTKSRGIHIAILYHLYTAYLITKSDIKTTILPATTFGIAIALSGPPSTTDAASSSGDVLCRLPQAILWIWLNLWVFNLSNQRLSSSILEDSINKPWRAIPMKRLTATQARRLLLISIPIVLVATYFLQSWEETMALLILTWIYNDLGAGDEYFFVRNTTNALGFMAFSAGAAKILCDFPRHQMNYTFYQWLSLVGAAIGFTIQVQDMEDQKGDELRNRMTMPIVLGDRITRWVNAFSIVPFSVALPCFWKLNLMGYIVPVCLGTVIAVRTLLWRSMVWDKQTFQLWCLWLMTIYILPLIKHFE